MRQTMTKTRNATEEIRRLYDVKETLLGAGMFGKVYLAHSKDSSNIKYAVKVLQKKRIEMTQMNMLREELETLCELDHPYITTYVESFEDQKYLYIVMEYCQGKEMFLYLEEKEHFSERDAANTMYKVLEGLNHIHSIGVVHRDLKPENIMMDEKGEPRIIDFGLSKNTRGNTKVLKSIVGSKLYMAPEILTGDQHGVEADMWSIGIIIF